MARRVTLAQLILNALPMYSLQTNLLPASLCDDIEVLTRKFVWGSTEDQNKVHLVSWDQVCQPKEIGGLGLKGLRLMNEAFMLKICWGPLTQHNALWTRVICAKYKMSIETIPNLVKPKVY